jgi:hypothetical protein
MQKRDFHTSEAVEALYRALGHNLAAHRDLDAAAAAVAALQALGEPDLDEVKAEIERLTKP